MEDYVLIIKTEVRTIFAFDNSLPNCIIIMSGF
jgi:hypothetical protein